MRENLRIRVKIDESYVILAPLSAKDQHLCHNVFQNQSSAESCFYAFALLIRASLKTLVTPKGKYPLQFENGELTNECVLKLLFKDLEPDFRMKLFLICAELGYEIPFEFTHPDGRPLEGVEILQSPTSLPN